MKAEEVRHNQKLFLEECSNFVGSNSISACRGCYLPAFVVTHKTGTLNAPVWVANDAGIIYLPNGEHVIVSVFSHGPEADLNPREFKAAAASADERIAIGSIVYDYYTAQ